MTLLEKKAIEKRANYYRLHPEEFKLLKIIASSRGNVYDQMIINEVENNPVEDEVKTLIFTNEPASVLQTI